MLNSKHSKHPKHSKERAAEEKRAAESSEIKRQAMRKGVTEWPRRATPFQYFQLKPRVPQSRLANSIAPAQQSFPVTACPPRKPKKTSDGGPTKMVRLPLELDTLCVCVNLVCAPDAFLRCRKSGKVEKQMFWDTWWKCLSDRLDSNKTDERRIKEQDSAVESDGEKI